MMSPVSSPFTRRIHGRAVMSAVLCGAALLLATPLVAQQQPLVSASTRNTLRLVRAEATPVPPTPPAGEPQGGGGAAPIKDDLFAGTEKFAKGATDATEVNMDPDSLNLVGGANAARARRTVLNVVRTYSYDKPGMYNPADVDEYRRKLEGGDWHCSIHTRDLKSGESTDICNRRRAPDMIETAIITASPKELTFIHTIRKADGQGGRLGSEGPDDSLLNELPPLDSGAPLLLGSESNLSVMGARLEADALARSAEMEARSATMSARELGLGQGISPDLAELQVQLAPFRLLSLPDVSRLTGELQRQMQGLQQLDQSR